MVEPGRGKSGSPEAHPWPRSCSRRSRSMDCATLRLTRRRPSSNSVTVPSSSPSRAATSRWVTPVLRRSPQRRPLGVYAGAVGSQPTNRVNSSSTRGGAHSPARTRRVSASSSRARTLPRPRISTTTWNSTSGGVSSCSASIRIRSGKSLAPGSVTSKPTVRVQFSHSQKNGGSWGGGRAPTCT